MTNASILKVTHTVSFEMKSMLLEAHPKNIQPIIFA